MSIETIKAELLRFLSSPAPEVLCLRGRWGVGKTFFWKELIEAERGHLNQGWYSYVSLFGLNSLDDLKYSIFENTVTKSEIGIRPSLQTFIQNRKGVEATIKKAFSYLERLSGTNFIRTVAFLSVSDQLICIDDLDRMSDGLSIRDVLGMISYLKEERRCKVLVILNDVALPKSKKKELEKQFEKVIDASLEFRPTPAECSSIALKGNEEFYKQIKDRCDQLEISNIRIIKRIERLVLSAISLLKDYHPNIQAQAIQTLVLLIWAKYTEDRDRAPTVEFIRDVWRKSLGAQPATPQQQRWSSLLDEYGFRNMDEFDFELSNGVERGYFDESVLHKQASVLQKAIDVGVITDEFDEAWRLYHDSFRSNEAEIVEAIEKSFAKNIPHITPLNLDGTVRLLKELGRAAKARELLRVYMEGRDSEDQSFFDRTESPFAAEMKDREVQEAFDRKFASFVDKRDPKEVLIKISKDQSWGRADTLLLRSLSVADFQKMFVEIEGRELGRVVRAALIFGDGDARQISERATAALKKIAKTSRLNKRRVAKFGVTP